MQLWPVEHFFHHKKVPVSTKVTSYKIHILAIQDNNRKLRWKLIMEENRDWFEVSMFKIGVSWSYNLSKLNDFIFRSEASYHKPFILVLENVDDFLEGEKIVNPEM